MMIVDNLNLGMFSCDRTERCLYPSIQKIPTSSPFPFPDCPQLSQIFSYIDANYCQNIGLNDISQVFGYSPSYLTNLVRRLTGKTLYQWLIYRRMFQARYLLLNTDLPVHQIARSVGYEDAGHFIKHFRQHHALPPKTWREHRN